MRLLIHTYHKPAECVIDSRPYSIPPNKVFKVVPLHGSDAGSGGGEYTIPEEYLAQKIIEQTWHYGMVDVPVIETEGDFGVTFNYDAKAGIAQSREALIRAEEQMLGNYVKQCQERMSQQLPAFPPTGRVDDIIKTRGIDLKAAYNIVPIGYGQVAAAADRQAEMDELKRQNAELQEQFKAFMASQAKQPKQPSAPAI